MTPIFATVVGSSPAIPRAGRACSAYFLEGAGARFAVDFGSGAYASLREVTDPGTLDAIVITHMHADHFIDLVPLRYALKYGVRTSDRRLPVYLPPGGEKMLRTLTGAFGGEPQGDFLGDVFEVRTFDPAKAIAFGTGALRFAPTAHYIPTFAVRFDVGGRSITYSSDTAPCEEVVALAKDTSLFICEATLIDGNALPLPRGHSSASEAGAMATAAQAARLVLSHWPAETDPHEITRHARSTYAGPIDVADDLDRFEV